MPLVLWVQGVPERFTGGVEDGGGVRRGRVEFQQAQDLRDEAVGDGGVLSSELSRKFGPASGPAGAQREVAAVEECGAVDEDEAVVVVKFSVAVRVRKWRKKKQGAKTERNEQRKKKIAPSLAVGVGGLVAASSEPG